MAPLLLLLLLFSPPAAAAASLRETSALFRSQATAEPPPHAAPTTFFEVTKPISLPKTTPCSYLLLRHDFAYTYTRPPVAAAYSPPTDCPSQTFDKIVLEWSATCKGRQFDRIFGVWLGGVELLRSCTAEPTAAGIFWTVKKDVTRYRSLLLTGNQTLAVYLGNVVDKTYTGVYHVNVSLHFYPAEVVRHGNNKLGEKLGFPISADLILPISRNLPLNDGLWFEITNSTQIMSKSIEIPLNSYRAVLELYVSYHENDEFYYQNLPNDYIAANNISGAAGNGPFREVVVSLDESIIIGAISPFTVIYTGGVNPLLWRPITGIGSFNVPSYDIEITPFLAKLLDGKSHTIGFSVTNALNVWYVDANLHLWLDGKSSATHGALLKHESSPLSLSLVSNFTGLDGSFVTNASRSIVSVGWVNSSHGMITTHSRQGFTCTNVMTIDNDGNSQAVDQVVNLNATVEIKTPSSPAGSSAKLRKKFTISLRSTDVDKGNGTYDSVANVTLGMNEDSERVSESGLTFYGKVKNVQKGDGYMVVKGNLVSSGLGSTRQEYESAATGETCYYRNVSSSNYTIIYDEVSDTCKNKFARFRHSYFPRRAFLGSTLTW
ncbi:peptide-N4-(N-acetyl-beta-glucosaminyl)asparagine amidase A-like [Andrographis paniculata]|uniref:peptide-N4-(N-acetyl-beta- glucosaminyl)asparagine amidase A-like n=1 Tax=Andrographis paniculata TaxID=175694 RepID=UPI0021E862F5|nr:peptide-N4-(N-acetyl-beta-glucosaminyl)asparagine amidase A-like [Andrographis paniculata]